MNKIPENLNNERELRGFCFDTDYFKQYNIKSITEIFPNVSKVRDYKKGLYNFDDITYFDLKCVLFFIDRCANHQGYDYTESESDLEEIEWILSELRKRSENGD